MSDKIKLLENKVQVIEQKLDSLSHEFKTAFNYLQSDPAGSLNKTRIVMEKILFDIYNHEMGEPPKKKLIGDILKNNQFTRKIERRILSRIHAIRDMSNLGTHGEMVYKEDAIDILDNLIEVIMWYFDKYLSIEFNFENLSSKVNDEKPPVSESKNNISQSKSEPRRIVAKRNDSRFEKRYYFLIIPVLVLLTLQIITVVFEAFDIYSMPIFQNHRYFTDLIFIPLIWAIYWFLIRSKPSSVKYYPIIAVFVGYILGRVLQYYLISVMESSTPYSFMEYFLDSISSVWFLVFLVTDVTFVYFINQYYSRKKGLV